MQWDKKARKLVLEFLRQTASQTNRQTEDGDHTRPAVCPLQLVLEENENHKLLHTMRSTKQVVSISLNGWQLELARSSELGQVERMANVRYRLFGT